MKIGMSKNEYGTPVSVHICDTCGTQFTVCPAILNEKIGWENCLGIGCKSYDKNRDADRLFDNGACNVCRSPAIIPTELLEN